ncbi:hypothetical protein [Coxiella endosymbiont of Ornithodoros amblus]|uniref:hypothetical protein n=1 Tax=Coxiella endosymbiont of Ornithodoros amblus TaxID=1656166 RepID=UPI0031379EF5
MVEKLLYTEPREHPQVIQEGLNAPLVLFKVFGDSSLAFNLLCVIPNVNLKYIVQSDPTSLLNVSSVKVISPFHSHSKMYTSDKFLTIS